MNIKKELLLLAFPLMMLPYKALSDDKKLNKEEYEMANRVNACLGTIIEQSKDFLLGR